MNDTTQVISLTAIAEALQSAVNAQLWDKSAGMYIDNDTTSLYPQDGNCWAVISGLADKEKAIAISRNLAARWGLYGAPAPEAGTTVSPFISSLELQAHFLAGEPNRAMDLMRLMWADFMLDDPRMTNSTFIEGYDMSGMLHYSPYKDDARVSHAHGWSTGPVTALTKYAAGLNLEGPQNWTFHPQPGNLNFVDAGSKTDIGAFSATYRAYSDGLEYEFATPVGTAGRVVLGISNRDGEIWLHIKQGVISPFSGSAMLSEKCDLPLRQCRTWNTLNDLPKDPNDPATENVTIMAANLTGGEYTIVVRYKDIDTL